MCRFIYSSLALFERYRADILVEPISDLNFRVALLSRPPPYHVRLLFFVLYTLPQRLRSLVHFVDFTFLNVILRTDQNGDVIYGRRSFAVFVDHFHLSQMRLLVQNFL